jgi:hypothetical protein
MQRRLQDRNARVRRSRWNKGMSEARPGNGDGSDAGGVFGNLPGSRPGSRSPRRRSGDAPAPAKPKPASRKRPAAARAQPTARPRPPARPPAPEPRAPQPEQPAAAGGLEDVAWAGVAVAAEAATIGVRLASRAIEALRGSTERGSERE